MEQARYKSVQITVTAFKWDESLGSVGGVLMKPKKHEFNPSDFYVKDRFGKEKTMQNGDWVVQFADGSVQGMPESEFFARFAMESTVETESEKPKVQPKPVTTASQPATTTAPDEDPDPTAPAPKRAKKSK